ncbi:hypothetical protein SDC9_156172 [bioreactor metagenome]|uniref:Uncharacterized protein n=1 Tax=bioreactor metagenome TaxID=1076179 RepID=A0A645F5I6_9ZZZZ
MEGLLLFDAFQQADAALVDAGFAKRDGQRSREHGGNACLLALLALIVQLGIDVDEHAVFIGRHKLRLPLPLRESAA